LKSSDLRAPPVFSCPGSRTCCRGRQKPCVISCPMTDPFRRHSRRHRLSDRRRAAADALREDDSVIVMCVGVHGWWRNAPIPCGPRLADLVSRRAKSNPLAHSISASVGVERLVYVQRRVSNRAKLSVITDFPPRKFELFAVACVRGPVPSGSVGKISRSAAIRVCHSSRSPGPWPAAETYF